MLGATPRRRESHNSAGGKDASIGLNYQLSVLMHTFLRALQMKDDFSLGTEVKEAGKFDDVVYRYWKEVDGEEKRFHRLVQLKHKSDPEKSKITLSALSSKSPKSDLGLITYFNSFREIKDNFSQEDEEIGDLIIYTNGRIKWRDRMTVNRGSDDEVTFIMKDALVKRSDFKGEAVKDELLRTVLYRVANGTEERRKWAKYLTENSSRKDIELQDDVELFLNKLCLAIDQPEEKELNEMILDGLKEYVNGNVHEAYAQFHTYMHRWLTDKKGFYLDREDGLKILEDLTRRYGGFKFGVDRPVLSFSGREKELDDLWKAFAEGRQRVVVRGLGGIGKTQLVKKFLEKHSESYTCIMWMKAESFDDLEHSFKRLAFDKLGIVGKRPDGEPKDIESILEEMKQCLKNRNSIFVFDNVRYMVDGTTDMNVFLKKLPDKAVLLMTSRCGDWDNFLIYSLESLSDEDATNLVKESLNDYITFEDEQVKALAVEMQNYPLAIQQAIACIKRKAKSAKQHNKSFGIDSYLKSFRENSKTLLEHQVQKYNEDSYLNTTMTTWDITMEDIRNNKDDGALSEKILNTISYFFPDGILLSDIIQSFSDETEKDIIASLQLLDDYSMVNFVNGQCSVHRLVQKVTRMKLKEKEEDYALLDSVLRVCEKLEVRNVVSIWEHCAEHEDLIRKHSEVPYDVIDNLIEKGIYADGYMYGRKLVKVMEALLDPMDESMIVVNFALAKATHSHGMYNESYELYKNLCEISCRTLGEQHPTTLKIKNHISLVLSDLGRNSESYKMVKEVSQSYDRIVGLEHRESIMARHILALALRGLKKYVKSYKMIMEVCDTCERVFGVEDPYFNNARHSLALVLHDLGRCRESFDILKDVWEWRSRNMGEEHPHTLYARHNMGAVVFDLGNYAECLEILECVYECRRRTLGEEHPHTLSTKHVIAIVVQLLSRRVNSNLNC